MSTDGKQPIVLLHSICDSTTNYDRLRFFMHHFPTSNGSGEGDRH